MYDSRLKLSEYICLEEYRAKENNKYYFCNFRPINEGVIFDLSYNDVPLRRIKNNLLDYQESLTSKMIQELMANPNAMQKYQNKN